ncbi:hypothetical protein [Zhihengliuella halotolerans]|uniref:hypothetical protein n=1 Tax=Zhihengliuella halotolerans TaxID=370736 RepID=UPI0011AF4A47|nr:hypothetical protein [Zhihengliuella halotolerans]
MKRFAKAPLKTAKPMMALVVAIGLVAMSAPASTAAEQPAVTSSTDSETSPRYSLTGHHEDGKTFLRAELTGGTFASGDAGSVLVLDENGTTVEILEKQMELPDGSGLVDVTYSISSDGTSVDIFYKIEREASENGVLGGGLIAKPYVNQKCARDNLLWGLGGGALTGAAAGPGGIMIGALTGAIISGVQSANTC